MRIIKIRTPHRPTRAYVSKKQRKNNHYEEEQIKEEYRAYLEEKENDT